MLDASFWMLSEKFEIAQIDERMSPLAGRSLGNRSAQECKESKCDVRELFHLL